MGREKPIIVITMGDPLGIGPEVLVKALARPEVARGMRALAVGRLSVLRRAAGECGLELEFRPAASAGEALFRPGVVDVLEPEPGGETEEGLDGLERGRVHPLAGKVSVEYVIRAAELVLAGGAAAMVTGPLNKEAVRAGGYGQFIGNTEILEWLCSERTGGDYRGRCTTMLITKKLRVAHVTRHVPFAEIVSRLDRAKIEETIQLTSSGMAALGFPQPRIAVAGLNPHNGEGGLMGREEGELIGPAVERMRAGGIRVEGPIPADSIFFKAMAGDYDAVVALYHDQGHIAVKVHGFEESFTVSLGLPLIRTSVDHGTAFDIVGQGRASGKSMAAALKTAKQIVRNIS